MAFKFRSTKCVLILAVILCIFPSNTAKQQAKKKHKFKSLKGILPFLEKKEQPIFHNRYLDWNLTNQLSAARYMLNLYKNLDTDDNSQAYNVSNVTATKQVEKADTIMGILNDGKLCLSVNMLIFAFVCVHANKQSSLDTTRY